MTDSAAGDGWVAVKETTGGIIYHNTGNFDIVAGCLLLFDQEWVNIHAYAPGQWAEIRRLPTPTPNPQDKTDGRD